MSSKVYFTREITPEKVVALYRALGVELPGKVAVKVHSGEKGNHNFLHPDFWDLMIRTVNGTVVECNTAYSDKFGGVRDHTESHLKLLAEHGWTPRFMVDIMDSEGPDLIWPIPHGKVLKENLVGRLISTYDSMLVLAHFKGHPMGGYGGALKQLAIGCASRGGKAHPFRRQIRRPVWCVGGACLTRSLPGSHGGYRLVHRRSLQKPHRLHQRHEESFGRLRLRRRR